MVKTSLALFARTIGKRRTLISRKLIDICLLKSTYIRLSREVCWPSQVWVGKVSVGIYYFWTPLQVKPTAFVLSNCLSLGDSGYGIKPFIMTPYLNPVGDHQHRYNSAHKKTRFIVENGFGDLKNRWRCLHRQGVHKTSVMLHYW